MRILLDATCVTARVTGSARYLMTLVEALGTHQPDVAVEIFGFERHLPMALPEGMTYRKAPLLRGFGPAAREVSRRRYVHVRSNSESFDLVHFVLDPAPVRGTKTVFTLFDLARQSGEYKAATRASRFRSAARTRLRYGLARRMDRVITTSEAARDSIVEQLGIDVKRIDVNVIAHDTSFTPGPVDADVLDEIGMAGKSFALFVGQFGRQKNEERLLRAFFQAKESGALNGDSSLVLVGSSEDLTDSTRRLLSERRGRDVVIVENVPDDVLVHCYRAARCVCLPSSYEGYGLPVQEAMACGTPSIVSNVTSLPEIAMDSGLAVAPDDETALCDALVMMFTDDKLRASLSGRARELAAGRTMEVMARQHVETYRKVIDDA